MTTTMNTIQVVWGLEDIYDLQLEQLDVKIMFLRGDLEE